MRSPALATLASLLSFACGDNGDMQITQTNPTSLSTGSTGADTGNVSVSSEPVTSTMTATTSMTSMTMTTTTTGEVTTDEPTSEPLTTAPTSDPTTGELTTTTEATTDGSSSGGEVEDLMKTYGHACATADCKVVLGPDGVCQKDILGVYNLPGGYCTIYCQLPDQQTTYITDAPDCPNMADCVGLMGYFEACAHACTDDSQCPRDSYECRQMPQISTRTTRSSA